MQASHQAQKRRPEASPPSPSAADPAKQFITFAVRSAETQDEEVDPRAVWSQKISELSTKLRADPTLPLHADNPWKTGNTEQCWTTIEALPAAHCAFATCGWTGDTEDDLCEHLLECHDEDVKPCMEAGKLRTSLEGGHVLGTHGQGAAKVGAR